MALRQEILLPSKFAGLCWGFAYAMVRNYQAGGSPNSRAVSYRGMENNVQGQAAAKMAECIFALEVGLDPRSAVKWDLVPDGGADVVVPAGGVDVKNTDPEKECLIWSVGKNHIFDTKKFDFLMLTKVELYRAAGFSVGFVSKQEFFQKKEVADQKTRPRLDKGTWFMREKALHDAEPFLAEARRASNPLMFSDWSGLVDLKVATELRVVADQLRRIVP